MAIIEGRTWLETLSRAECYELLAKAGIGRIAFVADDMPQIFPVTYSLDGKMIVFRTDPGTKLDCLRDGADVVFEIDSGADRERGGESVIVHGTARQALAPEDLRRLEALPLTPWAHGEKSHWIVVRPQIVTGRRIRPAAPKPGSVSV